MSDLKIYNVFILKIKTMFQVKSQFKCSIDNPSNISMESAPRVAFPTMLLLWLWRKKRTSFKYNHSY